MKYLSGLIHLDGGAITGGERAEVRSSIADGGGPAPETWEEGGVLMAQADPPPIESCRVASSARGIHATSNAAIAFDGRLDNRADLRMMLHHVIQGQPDNDDVLALAVYERSGGEGLVSLVGDFSLAIFDRVRRSLVLASDYAGVRPLYYSVSGGCVQWSSRLKPLAQGARAGEIDDEFVANLLAYGSCPHRTPYRGVYSVPPGHFVVASSKGVEIRPFWKLPIGRAIRYARESEYEEQLRELFREAVRARLDSESPVIAELSGGFDSSSIVCMANQLARGGDARTPEIVTLTYERERSRDEYFYRVVEAFCGFRSIHLSTADHAFLAEGSTGDAVPAFWQQMHVAIAKVAREQGARTVLTGILGDLVMGNFEDDSGRVLRRFRAGQFGAGLRESLEWALALEVPIWWVLGRAMMSTLPPSLGGAVGTDDSITAPFRARMGLGNRGRFSSQTWAEAPPERRRVLRGLSEMLELRRLQAPEPMQHLSHTHPFSHRPLVEFMLSVPAEIVCRPGEPRRLMRRAFQGMLPRELWGRRSKDAFGGVFLDSLRPLAEGLLRGGRPLEVVERGWVDAGSLKERLERIVHSLDCNEPQLRQIILLEYWLRGSGMRLAMCG